jgi:K+-transporting ATPase A subunit
MRRLWLAILPYTVLLTLALASVAHAENNGRGFYGETDDKVVTNFGFAVIIFFALFVFLMSMLQRSLDRRKDRRKAAEKQLGNGRWPGGW